MTVSCQTVVYAESEEEALEIADAREPAEMCHGALHPEQDDSWHFQNDAMPVNLEVEK